MRLWHVILLLFVCGPLLAQGELDPQNRMFWRNERSLGVLLNTDGWSVVYRELRQVKPNNRYFIEGSVEGFKNPKELKLSNYYNPGYGTFVFGKLNSTWTIGLGAGWQQEIFEKHDLGGVSVSWFAGGGATLLFAKPIYYKIIVDAYSYEEMKFDVTVHQPVEILGKASFFKGFDEIKLYPGLYARGGFDFEYSKNDKLTHALEIGTSVHAFTQTIPIMAGGDNRQVFPAIFISYRIGWILDPINPQGIFRMFSKKKPVEVE